MNALRVDERKLDSFKIEHEQILSEFWRAADLRRDECQASPDFKQSIFVRDFVPVVRILNLTKSSTCV